MLAPNGTVSTAWVHVDAIRLLLIEAEVFPSPLLVFHVGYIGDRRVIKADINARPFPLPLSCRPTGQGCASAGLEDRVGGGADTANGFSSFPVALDLKERRRERIKMLAMVKAVIS